MISMDPSFFVKVTYAPRRVEISAGDDSFQTSGIRLADRLLKDALAREQILLGQVDVLRRQQTISSEFLDRGEYAAQTLAKLTKRQKEILKLILAGKSNKIVAFDTGINQRTVENHRAAIMRKAGVGSITALTRLALSADLYQDQ